jgi:hypothetical protein
MIGRLAIVLVTIAAATVNAEGAQCKIVSIGTGEVTTDDFQASAWFNKDRSWIYVDVANKTSGTIELVVRDWYVVVGNAAGYLLGTGANVKELGGVVPAPILVPAGKNFRRPFTPRLTRTVVSVFGIEGEIVNKIVDESKACELADGIKLRFVLMVRDQEVRGTIVIPVQLDEAPKR